MYHGNEGAKFLYTSWRLGFVTDEALRDVILETWKSSWPMFALRQRDWLAMFSATGFVSAATPQPTEPLTIYRGAELSTRGHGMSWSLLRGIAEQHAEMQMMSLSGFVAGVFETTVAPSAVLAMIVEDAGEDEVIVNPHRLRGSSTPRLIEDEEVHDPFSGLNFSGLRWDALLKRVEFVSPCAADSPTHGRDHWRRVAEVGLELARETPGADPRVVLLFALFHDCLRHSEDDDPEHGVRAAKLVEDLPGLAKPLNEEKRRELSEALADHDRGLTTTNPTIGCCWDADRLDLGRVGIEPDAELMSTDAGRKRTRVVEAVGESPGSEASEEPTEGCGTPRPVIRASPERKVRLDGLDRLPPTGLTSTS